MATVARAAGRLGLVLSGGGARGAFQIGVYERLLEDPRFARGPSVLSGTSAGAINAALIAAGRSPSEMRRFWHGLGVAPPVVGNEALLRDLLHHLWRILVHEPLPLLRARADLARYARQHLPPRRGSLSAWLLETVMVVRFEIIKRLLASVDEAAIFDTAGLRAALVDELGGTVVPTREGVDLAINTMDALSGRVVRFVTRRTPAMLDDDYQVVDAITVDMVLASAAIPLLFPAVRVGGRLLWDGGVLVNTPLAPVVALGAEEIVTVLVTEPPDPTQQRFANLGDGIERLADSFLENTYNVDRKLLLERNQVERQRPGLYRPVRLYRPIRPGTSEVFTACSYIDFAPATLDALDAEGRRAVERWLDAGPPIERSRHWERAEPRPGPPAPRA